MALQDWSRGQGGRESAGRPEKVALSRRPETSSLHSPSLITAGDRGCPGAGDRSSGLYYMTIMTIELMSELSKQNRQKLAVADSARVAHSPDVTQVINK